MTGFRASWSGTKFIRDQPERKGLFGNVKGKTVETTRWGWVVGVTTSNGETFTGHLIAVLPDGETKVQFMDPDDVQVRREVEVV
jgi:hypothetical protein